MPSASGPTLRDSEVPRATLAWPALHALHPRSTRTAVRHARSPGGILPERMWVRFAGVLHRRLVFDEISPPSHVFQRAISFVARDLCALRHRPYGP